ncbi:MAG TPA: hypothetical protein VI731_01815 [Bacteroidia bacterium]|nr:hypothetical protein [Bacteroidia bacterium]
MRTEIRYIENKGTGEAWIGYCQFSKSGRSVYFNNKVFKRAQGISGNHIDIETGEVYWISGIKKNGADRHWTDSGHIFLDISAKDDYLRIISSSAFPKNKFILVELVNTPNKKLSKQIENAKTEDP